MSGLRIRGLDVELGGRAVLQDVDLEAGGGEMIGLLGPNGAGKSTFLRAVCQLIPVRRGEIAWMDGRVDRMSARERATAFAYLPQGQVLNWPISVRRLVELGRLPRLGRFSRVGPADTQAVDAAMALADITQFSERAATSLSGGERARALLARAFAVEAPVLLVDEPTASLDPLHALQVMEALKRVAHEGRLVIAVTHDLGLAARFCDRIVLLNEGRKVADGSPAAALTPERLQAVYRVDPSVLTGWTPAAAVS